MTADANQEQTQTETPATAPESQPAEGGDTPAKEGGTESASVQQVQHAQQTPMIPKWRLDEVLEQNRQLKAQAQQYQPQAQTQKPAGDGRPKQEDFQTYEDYIRADTRFEIRQEMAIARQEEAQQSNNRAFTERIEKADNLFNEKLYEATTKNPALMQKLQNAPTLHPVLQLALKESESPMTLAEHLADNPVEILRLNQMAPDRAMREIGKIEAKLAGSSGQPIRKPSAGIPALDTVGTGTKTGPRQGDQLTQDDVIGKLYGGASNR